MVSNAPTVVLISVWSTLLFVGVIASPATQSAEDPTVRAAVERYYKALEAEDIDAYFALWSATAQRPRLESLKFLFESADERFFDIQIVRAVTVGDRLRVRIEVRRERTRPPREPGGPPIVQSGVSRTALTFLKEADDWKLFSEGLPADDLAAAVAAAATPEEREALLAAEPDLVDTALVIAMARIATNAAVVQAYPRAQALYERVVELARRTGSRKEEGEALQNLGNTLYLQRRLPEALAMYELRLTLEQERADDAAVASALGGMATIRYSLAEYSEALKRYRQALAIQERLADARESARTLISTGNVRYLQADYTGAIRDYARSRSLHRGLSDTDGETRALEGLGRTYTAQGDYAAALSAFAGVLAEGRARADRARQGSATQSIAGVHLRLGNLDAARTYYEESRGHFIAVKDLSGAGRVWQGLGMTELMAGRLEAAQQAYTESIATCAETADRECSAHAIVGLAFAQSAQEKFVDAIASYQKGIDAFAALGQREPAARAEVGLSQAFAGANNYAAGMEAASRARRAAVVLESDDVLWRALTAEARVLRRSGGADKAVAAARAAATVVDRMQSAALEKPATALPSDAAAALATLAVLQAETGDAAAAWTTAARMRVLDLRTALAVNERDIARGMTDEEREHERAESSELLSLQAQAARERTLPKPDAARLAALDQRIASAAAARTGWMQQLYERLPELRVWRGLAPSASEGELQALLTAGTVLLEFVVDDDDVLVVTATANEDRVNVAAYPIPIRRRTLAERVNALLLSATLRDTASWRKAAAEITRLLPPAATTLLAGASRIIVVPHDLIWRVPFEALPFGDGYLGDRARVVYVGSLAALVRSSRVEPAPFKTMLGIAAPELGSAVKEHLQQTAPGWTLRPRDGAERETRALAAVYESGDAVVFTGVNATESAFRTNAAGASALHVAAPFRLNSASPLFSPILLSGDRSSQVAADDGALEAREVMNLNLRARVVILSDGAATSMREGAAAADVLQWAWLAAGVPSVVLARWTTDPAASDALLAEFHRRLRTSAEPADALHAARVAIRARPEWSAPFYWAGWIGMGK